MNGILRRNGIDRRNQRPECKTLDEIHCKDKKIEKDRHFYNSFREKKLKQTNGDKSVYLHR